MKGFTSVITAGAIGIVGSLLALAGCRNEGTDEAVEHHEQHGTVEEVIVHLDRHKVLHAGIRLEPVAKRSVPIPLTLTGKVSFNEKRLAHVTARVAGRVEQVKAVTNDRVRSGETLIQLYSQEFLALQLEFLQAAQRLRRARADNAEESSGAQALVEAARRKLAVVGVDGSRLAELESLQTPRNFFEVQAPFDGIILESKVRLGESVQPGADLFDIADLRTLWVLADVYEQDLALVRTGMPATVEVRAYRRSWSGVVSSVYSVLDEKTRTVKARIEVKNDNGLLRPGMFCTVGIQTRLGDETIKVPASALLGETERHFVFVAINDTTFEKRDVRTGAETRDFAEILDGVLEGEKIVVRGGFFLKSELAKETFGEEH